MKGFDCRESCKQDKEEMRANFFYIVCIDTFHKNIVIFNIYFFLCHHI